MEEQRKERKRVRGRVVREGLDGDGGAQQEKKRAPRPGLCRMYTRSQVAAALPEIVERFVAEAKKGSIAHTRLLTTLGGLDQEPIIAPRKGKSVVRMLLENMAKLPNDEAASQGSPRQAV